MVPRRNVEVAGVMLRVEYVDGHGKLQTPSWDEVRADMEAAGYQVEIVDGALPDCPAIDGFYRVGVRVA